MRKHECPVCGKQYWSDVKASMCQMICMRAKREKEELEEEMKEYVKMDSQYNKESKQQ